MMPLGLHSAVAAGMALVLGAGPPDAATPAWPDLSIPAPEQGGGSRDAAVIVGISDYAFVPDIPGAVANAEAWYTYLTVTRGIPAARVRLLRDNEGSAEEILAATEQAAGMASRGGRVWFVFIGHGAPARHGDDGLLIAVDAQQTANSLETRSLRQGTVVDALERSAAAPVVVLDACFSGKSTDGSDLAKGLQPLQVAKVAPPEHAVVLTAARSDQYAGALPSMDRPAFSYLLLGALRGWGDGDGDGRVTADEALSYTDSAMRTVIRGRSQTPELRATSGAAVLSRAMESAPDLRDIVLGRRSTGPVDTLPPEEPEPVTPSPVPLEPGKCVTDSHCTDPQQCIQGNCEIPVSYVLDLEDSGYQNQRVGRKVARAGIPIAASGALMMIGAGITYGLVKSEKESIGCGVDCTRLNSIQGRSALTMIASAFVVVGGGVVSLAGVITRARGRKQTKRAEELRRGGSVALSPAPAGWGLGLRGRF